MCLSKTCVCVCARGIECEKSLTNLGICFSHSMQPKQLSRWQSAAVKTRLLKKRENRQTDQRELVCPPLFNLFNLKTITELPKPQAETYSLRVQLFCECVLF